MKKEVMFRIVSFVLLVICYYLIVKPYYFEFLRLREISTIELDENLVDVIETLRVIILTWVTSFFALIAVMDGISFCLFRKLHLSLKKKILKTYSVVLAFAVLIFAFSIYVSGMHEAHIVIYIISFIWILVLFANKFRVLYQVKNT